MEDELILSACERALNDSVIYFTINLNSSAYRNASVSDLDVCNNTLDDPSTGSTSSADDGSVDDRKLMHIVLEDWLVHSIRCSPNQRLTWDEILSLFRRTTSSLLLSWYMSQGPEGLFYYFTTRLPGSAIICHNHVNDKINTADSTPPTTTTSSSNTDHLDHEDLNAPRAETAEYSGDTPASSSALVATTFPTQFLPIIDFVHRDNNEREITNEAAISRDSNSKSFGSFITFQSSMEGLSIQSDFDFDVDDEYDADIRDAPSIPNEDKLSVRQDDQYCIFDEECRDDETTILSFSPAESPEYKNYSMKEIIFYPEAVRWYNCQWKQNVTIWLLNLLRDSSSIKLWFDFVALEFNSTFGIASTDNMVEWIHKELPDVTISKSSYDGELYIHQASSYTLLQIE